MKVDVYSRRNVAQLDPNPEVCLISVWSLSALGTMGYEDNIPLDGWRDSLKLEFDDVTHNSMDMYIPFDEEMGQATYDFMHKYMGHDFVIHCDAGFSRSVAMGAFMAQAFGYDPIYHECGHDGMRNILVFNILRRIWREIYA
jgi:predicted protein tyrosine phosphatase